MTAEVHWQRKVKPPNATDIIDDIATAVFHVIGHTQSGGTEASPFSAAV